MANRSAIAAVLVALSALPVCAQQRYTGGPPPNKNIPFIVQADNLIETETTKASEQKKKDDTIYTIAGDKSTSRTPLASPMLVIDSDGLDPTKLQLFRLEVKNGHREITFKKKPRRRNLWAKASVRDGCRRGTSGAFCRWNQRGRMPRSSLAVIAVRRVRMSVM